MTGHEKAELYVALVKHFKDREYSSCSLVHAMNGKSWPYDGEEEECATLVFERYGADSVHEHLESLT